MTTRVLDQDRMFATPIPTLNERRRLRAAGHPIPVIDADRICEWIEMHGLDPNMVGASGVRIEADGAGGQVIVCQEYAPDVDGRRPLDALGYAIKHERRVSLVTAPPCPHLWTEGQP